MSSTDGSPSLVLVRVVTAGLEPAIEGGLSFGARMGDVEVTTNPARGPGFLMSRCTELADRGVPYRVAGGLG
jgi:hypothetical protein